jgi:hypothetical protein
MRLRLFACVALAMIVVGALAWSSTRALAQGQKPEQGKKQSGELSADIEKALKAYDERMGRNLDKSRQDLAQLKKELHELIDLRIEMATSLAELRARGPMPGMGFGRPGGAKAARGRGEGDEGLAHELQQIHNQLRSELEQQQNQVAQLASQLRGMKQQGQQGSQGDQSGPGRRPNPGPNAKTQGQERDKG